MKAVSGKELSKALERHGWVLMRVHGSLTSTASRAALCVFPFLSTRTARSSEAC